MLRRWFSGNPDRVVVFLEGTRPIECLSMSVTKLSEQSTTSEISHNVPRTSTIWGFRVDPIGTHLSRTMMLDDLRHLFRACPASATQADYRSAVVNRNVLGKPTAAACRITYDRLRELYALHADVLLLRALRDLWEADVAGQPMLALLCATARDPILRAMTPFVLSLSPGTQVTPQMLSEEAERQFPGKFKPSVLAGLGRNAASTWQQAGLLRQARPRERLRAEIHTGPVAYAMLLGDLCGARGQSLFHTLWAQMLDSSDHLLREQALIASQQGWIEYRAAGDVIEVSFRHLAREE